jgi:hypothetical protein
MHYKQWHYDVQEGKCLPFMFGGCFGNANRFQTEEACANACEKRDLEVKGLPECHKHLTYLYIEIESWPWTVVKSND